MPVMEELWIAMATMLLGVTTLLNKDEAHANSVQTECGILTVIKHRITEKLVALKHDPLLFALSRQTLPVSLSTPSLSPVPYHSLSSHVTYKRNPALPRVPERISPHLKRSRRHRYVRGQAQAVQVGPVTRLDGHTKCV